MSTARATNVAIVGGAGALGRAFVSHFGKASWKVTSIDYTNNNDANRNIQLDQKLPSWTDRVKQVARTDDHDYYDVVINAGGGWAGGRFGQDETLDAMENMWNMNIQSSILASHLSARFLTPDGLTILTGADAALQATPDMAAYGMSKAATHHMVSTLAATLPDTSCVACILPITIDTPMNRQFMPDADHSSWTSVDTIALKCIEWANDRTSRPKTGALVSAITQQNETRWITRN